jgi:hypothetical protein
MDLDSPVEVHEAEYLTDCRMADLVDGMAILNLGIDHTDSVLEERRKVPAREVAILVDGRGKNPAAVLAIPGGIVGSTSEE